MECQAMRPEVSTVARVEIGNQPTAQFQILSGDSRKKITPKMKTEPPITTEPKLLNSPAAALNAPSAAVLPHPSAWVTKLLMLWSVSPKGPSFNHERISVSPDCRLDIKLELSAMVDRMTMNK